jgi:hypothetical protein
MKDAARLIIPAWGELYLSDVLSLTLPAVLAPGNLPALLDMFDVEIVIVTESQLFDLIRTSKSFQAIGSICSTRVISLDDLLTNFHGDYGTILTCALFRGFADLGSRMTETFLLFLNADFIISDGSLRHVGQLMRQGKRLIHAPSFRVVFEDVWPQLRARVDAKSCTLSMPSREMAKLALAHKHPTVRARTVNQRLSHQKWMDQFYWYVDEDTLIGYQSPIALVAIKPERVVGAPKVFWDYGFVPEAAPTTMPHFITDSDDFFMIEPQNRDHQAMLIRVGWVSMQELASNESLRATKEHRASLKQLLKIHASELPSDLQDFIDESHAFMAEIHRRLSPNPAPHTGHPLFGWWSSATPAIAALRTLQTFYRRMFGSPPKVGKAHPLWIDTASVAQKTAAWKIGGRTNILAINSGDWPRRTFTSGCGDAKGLPSCGLQGWMDGAPYDACICELTLKELEHLDAIYAELRPLIKDGGQVLFKVANPARFLEDTAPLLRRCRFPDVDVSEIRFYGTSATALLRAIYFRALRPIPSRPIVRGLGICALILLAPLVWLANVRAAQRDPTIFSPKWTILMLEFTVRRGDSRLGRSSADPWHAGHETTDAVQ